MDGAGPGNKIARLLNLFGMGHLRSAPNRKFK